ncbi:NAD-dependent epimerase/dehydratase family protein [Paraburkholderia sp. LEh10]|nr:NAD-dependent epimerase/dehydratase family protein [Paraburkholderia sp. LEh10]
MTTVFLTGASGFLGGHLLRELHTAGCAVRAMSRRAEADAIIAKAGGDPVRSDLRDATSLQAALAGCEAAFHAAADTSMWRSQATAQTATNVLGTENLLRAAELAGVQAFVHTSSVSAYSYLAHGTLVESTPQRGAESWINYERTKYLGERAVRACPGSSSTRRTSSVRATVITGRASSCLSTGRSCRAVRRAAGRSPTCARSPAPRYVPGSGRGSGRRICSAASPRASSTSCSAWAPHWASARRAAPRRPGRS